MPRSTLEVADIFRAHGPTWREQRRGHFSLGQLKVMSAIEQCRSLALGTALARGAPGRPLACAVLPRGVHLAGAAQCTGLYKQGADVWLLFDIVAETLRTIAADPQHLGARIGTTLVLHTWGSALTHHPHVHGIVPGGGLAPHTDRWVPCKPGFFLLANGNRQRDIATARDVLHQPAPTPPNDSGDGSTDHGCPRPTFVCRHCGAPMLIIETFARAQHIRGPPGPSAAL